MRRWLVRTQATADSLLPSERIRTVNPNQYMATILLKQRVEDNPA